RGVHLLAVECERRVPLHDDVELLLPVGTRPELVVLADHLFAGLGLVDGARAECAYVERAAEADEHPVVVTLVRLLRKGKNAVRRLCGCHCGLLDDRVPNAAVSRSRAVWSSWTSWTKCGSGGYVAGPPP